MNDGHATRDKTAPCGVCRYEMPDVLPSGWTMSPRPLDRTFIRVDERCPEHNASPHAGNDPR